LVEKSQLRAAREAAGLTVEQVSQKTNIRIGVIEDLEKNSVEVSGGIAYARGHIRSIAKVIKADGDLLVAEIESAQGGEIRKIVDRFYENNVLDRPKVKKTLKFGSLAAIAAAVLAIGFIITIAINNSSTTSGKVEITPSNAPTASNATDAMSAVNLVFTGVDGKSWIGIIDATGKEIFDGQIKSGETKSFKSATDLKVTIGNAAAVKVTLNGSDLGVPGGYGEVVKYTYSQSGAIKE
jgi:cytoskeletal protein RodZ